MKDSNNFYKSAQLRAGLHLIGLPILLFIVVAIIDKQMSLVAPALYVIAIGILQFIRLKNTDKLEHQVYSRTFFTYLKNILTFAVVAIIVMFLVVAS